MNTCDKIIILFVCLYYIIWLLFMLFVFKISNINFIMNEILESLLFV
jgi:hypothetical protein